MKKYITKKNIIILCSILIILFCLILHFTQQNKISDLPEGNRIDSAFKNINMKDVCEINASGVNGEGQAFIKCDVPEFEKRKQEFSNKYESNRINYFENYTDEEKNRTSDILLKVLELSNDTLCTLDKTEKISNGDKLKISCSVENLKYLNYITSFNNFEYEVDGLAKTSDPSEELPKQEEDKKEPIINDLKETETRIHDEIGEGGVVLYPVNPKKYDFSKEKAKFIYTMCDEIYFEDMKKIAENEKRIVAIVVKDRVYFAEENFENAHEFYGFALNKTN